jgi:DNA-binding IclR family transcriptional regulator
MRRKKENGKRFTSLENALHVLELFSSGEQELGIGDMAERLGIANSTAHRLATTLMSEGFMAKNRHTNLYRLSTSILALGHIVAKQSELHNISKPVLEALVRESNETAHIGVLKDFDAVYLSKVDCANPVPLLSYPGKRNPAHCTSTGQVLLAHQPAKVQEAFLLAGLKRYTSKTITDPGALLRLFQQIENQGYALSVEELHEGVASISAPIRNGKCQVVASVSIAGPTQRINGRTIPRLIQLVMKSADEISRHLK